MWIQTSFRARSSCDRRSGVIKYSGQWMAVCGSYFGRKIKKEMNAPSQIQRAPAVSTSFWGTAKKRSNAKSKNEHRVFVPGFQFPPRARPWAIGAGVPHVSVSRSRNHPHIAAITQVQMRSRCENLLSSDKLRAEKHHVVEIEAAHAARPPSSPDQTPMTVFTAGEDSARENRSARRESPNSILDNRAITAISGAWSTYPQARCCPQAA